MNRRLLLLGGVVVLAAVLRFAWLGERSLWVDEGLTLSQIRGDLGHLIGTLDEEAASPLYPVLAWAWSQVLGTSEAALRSLPAIFGVATVPVVYAAGARVGGARAGLIGALLAAVSPLLVWHAQDARGYALVILLGSVAFLAFLHLLGGEGRPWLVVWGAASVLAIAAHYDAVFPFAVEAVWLLRAAPAPVRRRVAVACAVIVGAGLCMLPLAFAQSGGLRIGGGIGANAGNESAAGDATRFLGVPDVGALGRRIVHIGGQFPAGYQPPAQVLTVAVLTLLCAGAVALILLTVPRERLRPLVVPAGVGVISIVLPIVVAVAGIDQVQTRYQAPALVPLIVALAGGLALAPRRAALALTGALAVAGILVNVTTATDSKFGHEDWRAAVAALGGSSERRVVVGSPGGADIMLEALLPGTVEIADTGEPPPAVREVVALSLPLAYRELGDVPKPPRPDPPPAPRGFTLVERRLAPTFTLFRYRADRPTAPSEAELERMKMLPPFELMVVPGSK